MKIKLYAIKDTLVGFMTPYAQHNDAYAKRAFANAVNDIKPNNINVNPEDKQLYYVGEFDEDTGALIPCEKGAQFICSAMEVKKEVIQ